MVIAEMFNLQYGYMTRKKLNKIIKRNEMYCIDINKNKIHMDKNTDYLMYIRHVYKNKHWTSVAMNSKLCEKHRIEMMKEYHTHLYTFKDDGRS
jgi:hypothetical protein